MPFRFLHGVASLILLAGIILVMIGNDYGWNIIASAMVVSAVDQHIAYRRYKRIRGERGRRA